jgi:hypothetical protein
MLAEIAHNDIGTGKQKFEFHPVKVIGRSLTLLPMKIDWMALNQPIEARKTTRLHHYFPL